MYAILLLYIFSNESMSKQGEGGNPVGISRLPVAILFGTPSGCEKAGMSSGIGRGNRFYGICWAATGADATGTDIEAIEPEGW